MTTIQAPTVTLHHHKERDWATYLKTYSDLARLEKSGLLKIEVESLPQQNRHQAFAQLPERLRRLLFFAKPDLLVSLDDGINPVEPVFAFDVTEHVAARDHWIQRFPNLVACAEEGVPGAFVAPRDMPNRSGFAGRTDPVFFFAYDRVIEIHQTPIYIAEWPSSDGATLDGDLKYAHLPPHDSPGMKRTFQFFNHVLDGKLKGRELDSLMQERMFVDLRNDLRRIGYQNIPEISDFQRLMKNMPNGRPLTGREFQAWLRKLGHSWPSDLPDRILKRDQYLIYAPYLNTSDPDERRKALRKRIKQKSGDPYTQQPLVFDYLFCRLGPSPAQRDVSLVVDLSILYFSDFAEYVQREWKKSPLKSTNYADVKGKIPIYTLHLRSGIAQIVKTFVRLYSYSADLIVFRDGVLYF